MTTTSPNIQMPQSIARALSPPTKMNRKVWFEKERAGWQAVPGSMLFHSLWNRPFPGTDPTWESAQTLQSF